MTTPRELWLCFEPYHDVVYFTPETRAATDALGCKGGWMGYFGMRAAPLGAAPEWLVTSTFYNFHPSRVARAVPEVWSVASPETFLETRLAGVDGALRRLLGDEVAGDDLAEAAELAVAAAAAAPTAGRPLGAANAALPIPAEPHLALWQAATTLRESRGDGHIAALVTAGLDPCESLVLFAADHGMTAEYMQQARNWPAEEWAAARTRLVERGLLDADGLTEDGLGVRETVEALTDEAAAAPWGHLGPDATGRLVGLLAPLSLRIAVGNDAMRVNPMALAPEPELERLAGRAG
ncbi:SCO6745 family protein [Actinokineospora sp. NPDC004072]